MSINAVNAYNLKLQRKFFDDLLHQQLKRQQENHYFEAQRLRNFQEMTRLQRNQMHYKNYWDMQMYDFQRKTLTVQKDMLLTLGTNVDSYT